MANDASELLHALPCQIERVSSGALMSESVTSMIDSQMSDKLVRRGRPEAARNSPCDASLLAASDGSWRTATPHEGEDVRWESIYGKWVSVARGGGASAGTVLVADWRGRCESAENTEAALALAWSWRR